MHEVAAKDDGGRAILRSLGRAVPCASALYVALRECVSLPLERSWLDSGMFRPGEPVPSSTDLTADRGPRQTCACAVRVLVLRQ